MTKNNQKILKKNLRKLTKLFGSFRNANKDVIYSDILRVKVIDNKQVEVLKINRNNFIAKTEKMTFTPENHKLNKDFIDNLLFQVKLVGKHYDKIFIDYFITSSEIDNGNYIIYFDKKENNFKLMITDEI